MNSETVLRFVKSRSAAMAALALAIGVLVALMGGETGVRANVSGGDYVLTDSNGGAAQPIGAEVALTLTVGPLSQPVVGDLQVEVHLDPGDALALPPNLPNLGQIHNIVPGTGCTVSDTGISTSGPTGDILTCVFSGPLAALTAFSVTFDAYVLGDGLNAASAGDPFPAYAGATILAKDLGSAQLAQAGTDSTSGFLTITPAWDGCETAPACSALGDAQNMEKRPSVDPAYQTQPFTYQIFVDNDSFWVMEDFKVEDTLPAEYRILGTPAIQPSTYGDNGATQTCAAPAGQAITCTGLDLGGDNATDATFAVDNDALIIDVPVAPNPNSGAYTDNTDFGPSTAVTNAAIITCDGDGSFGVSGASCDEPPNVTDTYAIGGSTTIQRVTLDASAIPAVANGIDVCTVTTDNWDNLQLVGSPSADSDAPAGDWTVTGTATGIVKTEGELLGEQTLNLTATGGGTAIVSVSWEHMNAPALLGPANNTPTATCTFTGGITPTPSPSPSPTPTHSPTPTPTPTQAPSPTPTPTGGPGTKLGDVDCDGDVDSVDGLKDLRHVASLPVTQDQPCPDIGGPAAAGGTAVFGDVDCDADVDSVDGLKILRFVASLSVAQTEPCPDINT